MATDNKSLADALEELGDAWRELRDTVRDVLYNEPSYLEAALLVYVMLFVLCVVYGIAIGV